MYLDFTKPLFNLDTAGCRRAGAIGGRRSAEARRRRQLAETAIPAATTPERETAHEAIKRIDALCPWLIGAERPTTRRVTA